MKMSVLMIWSRSISFRPLIGCWLALALACGTGPALAIDPFFPTFGNNGIDVIHYNIDLDVDPVSGQLDGKTAIMIRAQKRLSSFKLDLHALAVSNVKINGIAAGFSQADDKLTITPDGPIPAGSIFWLGINYGGVPDPLIDPTASSDELFLGWFKYQDATYAVSEPVGASSFFPVNDEPTDKASYTFGITVPAGYTGVANGFFVGSKPLGSKRRFEWTMLEPMTSWLATVHVNKFELDLTHAPDRTPIRVYAPAGVPQSHIDVYAKAGPMIAYFETLIGRYPFASYGSVIVEDPLLYYALETQAMSTFPAGTNPPDEVLVAHELAHQWIGNSISVAKWEDLWIAEGSATYFEVLWKNRHNRAAFEDDMLAIYDFVADQQVGPAVVDAPDQMFSDRTYYRGAATLYALRLKVGDSSFFNILRHFVQDNRGGNITSEDFIRTAVHFSGDGSVRPLLHAWLYDDAVPALPSSASRAAKRGPVARPDIVGGRCGRGSHRGSPANCKM
ncbi:MAG: M1 family metallopeptidase [Propionivibrio sp.]|uniref:M1 family metallopeptidase n=1 Tax=Propionivibrio sp. TaxID=2212460 RepID=UPI001A377D2E|nr:M1 family metallopeptidase [Propionivibrio sp.]MBL8413202.1 M1 family metallopeptidase [Propionivibrio sp.]